ncbi:hypothetical protein M422DRAFT_226903 [Sphaerobolus stellatus SS14]|uniref:Phosphoglycerate mutase-like protein n=1 Tax=Sphaerobolus stellatus (strain SS14) TaxID=990650 RepID=A0A0C9W2I6_SPHS4|nr:hypothetical protein M422DRAFT_226903 [Sphaerobolus stellatus SS14]
MAQEERKRYIHILRHGEALHNVIPNYSTPDPPLTERGKQQATSVSLNFKPDLIICSPLTRTIETMYNVLNANASGSDLPIEIWPNVREALHGKYNIGSTQRELSKKFPALDFSGCHEGWEGKTVSWDAAEERAEEVLRALRQREEEHILVVSHAVFIYLMTQSDDYFMNCELRSYELDGEGELKEVAKNIDASLKTQR